MYPAIRISGCEQNSASVAGRKILRYVQGRVIGVVDDQEPLIVCIGKPTLYLCCILLHSTKVTNVLIPLLNGLLAASVNPENTPKSELVNH